MGGSHHVLHAIGPTLRPAARSGAGQPSLTGVLVLTGRACRRDWQNLTPGFRHTTELPSLLHAALAVPRLFR